MSNEKYALNICPSKMHLLKPNPICDGIWRWGLWEVIRCLEGGALLKRIYSLIKETPPPKKKEILSELSGSLSAINIIHVWISL